MGCTHRVRCLWLHGRSCRPIRDIMQRFWAALHETWRTFFPLGSKSAGTLSLRSGPGCTTTTTSQTDLPPKPKSHLLGCQLATVALKIKTVTTPEGELHGTSCHPIWYVSESGLRCTRLDGLSATLAVNRLGRCRYGYGLCCTTTSQTDPPPKSHLLGVPTGDRGS